MSNRHQHYSITQFDPTEYYKNFNDLSWFAACRTGSSITAEGSTQRGFELVWRSGPTEILVRQMFVSTNQFTNKGKKKHDSQKGEPKPRRVASSGLLPTISSFVIEQAKNPIEVRQFQCTLYGMTSPKRFLCETKVFLCNIISLIWKIFLLEKSPKFWISLRSFSFSN